MLADTLASVRQRIATAAQRSGRPPESVTLIGVTKTVPVEVIAEAIREGLTDLGENRVQEAQEKHSAFTEAKVRWHFIGHLQRNKAKQAIELFESIHSVDSVPLIEELQRHALSQAKTMSVFLQVNVSREQSKFGCAPEELERLAQFVQACSHLELTGLMTMAPYSENPEDARPHFRTLRTLREALARSQRLSLDHPLQLSMGMSHDFEVAIEESADLVRIGTAIFGARS